MAKGKKQKNRAPTPQKADGEKRRGRTMAAAPVDLQSSQYSSSLCRFFAHAVLEHTLLRVAYDDHTAIVLNNDVKGIAPLSDLWRHDFWPALRIGRFSQVLSTPDI